MENVKYRALNFAEGKAIYNYRFTKDSIEFFFPGSVITVCNSEEVNYIKERIHEAKKWCTKKQDILNYLEWCADNPDRV